MSHLLDRLRKALAPHFTVEREIAGGGMGLVFLGHDVTLDRPVAIKVLRPEQATAVGVERFLREARLLARLHHPNIVPVHQGGEADGLLYHVLELQAGGTLADRLARGALDRVELIRLADGLLGALAAAHAAGVVHRDIKPANIFFSDASVMVADFGIAHTDSAEESLTEPGRLVGTQRYMAPEQLRGLAATPATDVYSAAKVLLEAAGPSGTARLPRLPGGWGGPLRKALAEEPEARWPDATAFRSALLGPRRHRVAVVVAAALVTGFLAWYLRPPPPAGTFAIAVQPLQAGPDATQAAVDSVHAGLVAGLTGLPDIKVVAGAGRDADVQVRGTVRGRGATLEVALDLRRRGGEVAPVSRVVSRLAPADGLDSLVHDVLEVAWRGADRSEFLPGAALPRSPRGMARFLTADRLYAAGRWESALGAYEAVERSDTTCALCDYRIRDLYRWLNRERDSVRLQRLAREVGRFPAAYAELIEASLLPPAERLDRLTMLRERRQRFFDFQYLYGDELMHRGPLLGRPRRAALDPLEEARRLRPDFTGVVEHLLWVRTAEGDSAQAARLLADLREDHQPRDEPTRALRMLHELGYLWRFHPHAEAEAATREAVLGDPALRASQDLPAGPRMLPAFGAPGGAVGFGALLVGMADQPRLVRAGLVAQALGWVALGQPDSAFRAAADLARSDAEAPWRLLPLALHAWLVLLGEVPDDAALREQLESLAASRQAPTEAMRARWWLAMLEPARYPADDLPPSLAFLVRAEVAARDGRLAEALALSDSADASQLRLADPFAGALRRLRRAEWFDVSGRPADAVTELLWHEHTDLPEIPGDELQGAEVDWAAATLAIWRRAQVLAAQDPTMPELCRHWAEVTRRWGGGAGQAAARADSARRALAAHPRCGSGS